MKLEAATGIDDRAPGLVADTLKRVGAVEIASYVVFHGSDDPTIFVATDRGLANVRLSYPNRGTILSNASHRTIEVSVALTGWEDVRGGVTVGVMDGGGDRVEAGMITVMDLDPIERETDRGQEFDEFAAEVLKLARNV